MPPSIRDIALKVGRSITTVSRALHDYDDVSPETKALVRKVAAEMGYRPNTYAQRLAKQQTDTIGLILPTFGPRFSDPFFSEFIAGIGNKAAQLGYDLLVSTRSPGNEELQAYQFNVESQRVDGFIVVRTRCQDARIDYLRSVNFPFVSFGRVQGTLDFSFVDEDGEHGMALIIDYLASLGHRRFGYIAAPCDVMFAHHRLAGMRKKMAELGIPGENLAIIESDLTQRGGYMSAEQLLEQPDPPTAIIACNDLMAIGAMSAAQERGLEVGREVSVTGFDNIPMAEHSHPPLTTINQPIYQIGSMVCEMLIQRIQGEAGITEQVILEPSLVVRQSCGPVRTAPG